MFKTFFVKPKGFLPELFGLKTTMGFTFHIRSSWHTVGTFEGETVWELLTVCRLHDQDWMDTLPVTHSPWKWAIQKGNDSIPTIHFQVLLLWVTSAFCFWSCFFLTNVGIFLQEVGSNSLMVNVGSQWLLFELVRILLEIHAFFTEPMSKGGRGTSFTLFGMMESTNCVFEMGKIACVWREPYQLLVSFVNQCLGKAVTVSFLTLCFEHHFLGKKTCRLWSQQQMLKHHELSSIISGKMAAWQPVCFSRGP